MNNLISGILVFVVCCALFCFVCLFVCFVLHIGAKLSDTSRNNNKVSDIKIDFYKSNTLGTQPKSYRKGGVNNERK